MVAVAVGDSMTPGRSSDDVQQGPQDAINIGAVGSNASDCSCWTRLLLATIGTTWLPEIVIEHIVAGPKTSTEPKSILIYVMPGKCIIMFCSSARQPGII